MLLQLMTGTLLNQRYRIMRPLGKGGMGAVYEAVDLRLNNTVAVKQMIAEAAEANRAFEREARLLATLRHPALPVVIDYFTEPAGQFLVMQYIEGEDLAQALKRGEPLAEHELIRCAMTLAGALVYLHGCDPSIIHRDLKPQNIKRTPAGEFVLLDFGLATGRRDSDTTVAADGLSIYGYTPQYSPPEQLDARRTDRRSDIFALGATLFHLAAAMPPPPARERLRLIESGMPDPLAERLLGISGLEPRLHAMIARALALDPRDRFQDAAEILVVFSGDQVASRPTPTPEVSPERRRIDAALPSAAEVRRAIDLIVQVRFANSPLLGLEDWPSRRKPDRIEQASESLTVAYPNDPVTGELLPARLRIRIVTPDFVVTGASDHAVDVPPRDYSKRLAFLLTPARPGFCRVNVEVYAADSALLGMIAIETEAFEGTSVPAAAVRIANLDVHLVLEQVTGRPGVPLQSEVAQIGRSITGVSYCAPSARLDRETADDTPLASAVQLPLQRTGDAADHPTVTRRAKSYSYLRPVIVATAALTVMIGIGIAMRRRPVVTVLPSETTIPAAAVPQLALRAAASATLTISPIPTGGTVEGIDILCGTKGSLCSTSHPNGVPVELHPTADPGYTFMGFVGDCAPLGHTQMSGPRTCGATFSPTDSLKPSGDVSARSALRGSAVPPSPLSPQAASPPPPMSDDVYANNAVKDVLRRYCAAYEAQDPDAVQRVYPKAPMSSLRQQLNRSRYKSLQCTFGDPKFDALDTAAGTARIHVDIKHVVESTALGDKPEVREFVATISLSRASQRGQWFIDTAAYRPKPQQK